MEVTSVIGTDPQSVYHFGYPEFLALLVLKTKVNSFDDLNKNTNRLLMLLKTIHTTYLDINEPDSR